MRSVACTQLISRWFKHKYQIRLHVHDSFKHLFVISRQISSEKRDVEAIANSIRSLCELPAPTGLRGALVGDWRLLYVNEAETLHKFGTGLGKLPGTTIMDAWAAFSADGRVTVHEVCRVVGPFPNIRNTLEGTWELRGKAATGFGAGAVAAGATVASDRGLCLAYDRLTDGRGKTTTADTGFRTREVRCCRSPLLISVLHHVRNLCRHTGLCICKRQLSILHACVSRWRSRWAFVPRICWSLPHRPGHWCCSVTPRCSGKCHASSAPTWQLSPQPRRPVSSKASPLLPLGPRNLGSYSGHEWAVDQRCLPVSQTTQMGTSLAALLAGLILRPLT